MIASAAIRAPSSSRPGRRIAQLVAAEPERLAALAEVRVRLREHLVADGMAEAVVDQLELVDVDETEAERIVLRLRVGELALEPVVEVAVVPQPGQRIGQRQPHRARSSRKVDR